MHPDIRSASSSARVPEAIARELIDTFSGMTPVVIVFFAGHTLDGRAVSELLRRRFPKATVVGCTTTGEFTARVNGTGTTTALALGSGKVRRAAAALANFSRGVRFGIDEAMRSLSAKLDTSLRTVPSDRYAGVVLLEGLKMREEEANACLVQVAPTIRFVGGSAGDGCEYRRTRVFVDGQESDDGAALLVLDCAVPFLVSKTCSLASTGRRFKVTRADPQQRIVHELSGRKVADVYATALGRPASSIDTRTFRTHPLGIMVDGEPWVRSPKELLPDGSCTLFSQLEVGVEVDILEPTDLIADTRSMLAQVEHDLGRPPQGGLLFNCAFRRDEIVERKQTQEMMNLLSGREIAGFHTYGESLGAHVNQTLLALWLA